jgi:hypothetical protein
MPHPDEAPIGGHCWMPHEYLLRQDLAADFWVISRVE